MKIKMRAFVKRNDSGEIAIYGHSGNTDSDNEAEFDLCDFWVRDYDDRYAIVEMKFVLPDEPPTPKTKAKVTVVK
jgi:hypothetical protein